MIVTPAQMLATVSRRFPADGYAAGEMYGAFYAERDLGNAVLKCRATEAESDLVVSSDELAHLLEIQPGARVSMVSVYWPFGTDMLPARQPPSAEGNPFRTAIRHVLRCADGAISGLREAFDGLQVSVSAGFGRESREVLNQSAAVVAISHRSPEAETLGIDAMRRLHDDIHAFKQSLRDTGNLFDGRHPWLAGVGRVEIAVNVRL